MVRFVHGAYAHAQSFPELVGVALPVALLARALDGHTSEEGILRLPGSKSSIEVLRVSIFMFPV